MILQVRVHDDLVLNAGVYEEISGELVIHPPELSIFHQVLEYLRAKSDAPTSASGFTNEDEGAAAAITLRWGSYFAVLADRTKPVWSEARSPGVSRISVRRWRASTSKQALDSRRGSSSSAPTPPLRDTRATSSRLPAHAEVASEA